MNAGTAFILVVTIPWAVPLIVAVTFAAWATANPDRGQP